MIRAEQIPDEVVEAAAKALAADAKLNWDDISYAHDTLRGEARAAIAAALAAWPGVDYRPGAKVTKTWRDPGKIILPLPTENPND